MRSSRYFTRDAKVVLPFSALCASLRLISDRILTDSLLGCVCHRSVFVHRVSVSNPALSSG